jgi:eukaryotic-like serine/threonine-protein kinase
VLLDELGRGGMATVYRAHDEVLDRQVAIKVLHPHLATDEAFLDRFRREARAAAALSHPNVVAVHDWGESEEGAYLVLQLIEGPTLRQLLREHGQLSPEEAAGVLIPVARGLGAAHAAGMVHRDVKPENLLLGRDGIVRITDFGLARAIASANATFGTDVLIGSPHYLSPEAVEGDRLDPRADVYALGVILFECLTGAPPYSGETAFATAMQHVKDTVPAPSSLVDGIPPGVDDVVRWATAIDRDTRYPTGDDFARALGVAVPEVVPAMELDTGLPYEQTARSVGDQGGTSVIDDGYHLWEPPGDDGDLEVGGADDIRDTDVVGVWRRQTGWTAALVILGLILASGVGGYLLWDRLIAPVLPVPNVQGAAQAEAVQRLSEEGFEAEVAGSRFDLDAPEGVVLDQQPLGQARRGSQVLLVVSAGPRQVEVPDVLGWSEEDATEELREQRFAVDRDERHHDQTPEGEVIEVTPDPGMMADEASTVVLTVSLGPEPVAVPRLTGESVDTARELTDDLGLVLDTVDRRHDDSVPADHVISQDPDPEASVPPGTTVEVVVSAGPAPIEVPGVRDENVRDAIAQLEGLGFAVEVEWRGPPASWIWPGRVIDQQPAPGAQRLPGTTITLYAYED